MAEELKYLVTGNWKGESIERTVFAVSPKQAKFKAGMSLGIGGRELGEFCRSSNIVAVRRK